MHPEVIDVYFICCIFHLSTQPGNHEGPLGTALENNFMTSEAHGHPDGGFMFRHVKVKTPIQLLSAACP